MESVGTDSGGVDSRARWLLHLTRTLTEASSNGDAIQPRAGGDDAEETAGMHDSDRNNFLLGEGAEEDDPLAALLEQHLLGAAARVVAALDEAEERRVDRRVQQAERRDRSERDGRESDGVAEEPDDHPVGAARLPRGRARAGY